MTTFEFIWLFDQYLLVEITHPSGAVRLQDNLENIGKFYRLLDALKSNQAIDLNFNLPNNVRFGIEIDEDNISTDVEVGAVYTYIDTPLTAEVKNELTHKLQLFCDKYHSRLK